MVYGLVWRLRVDQVASITGGVTGCDGLQGNLRVAAARGEDVVVPRERRDARTMAVHRAHLLELVCIPQLYLVVPEVRLGSGVGVGCGLALGLGLGQGQR